MSGVNSLFRGMRMASSGLSAERVRLDVIAENIANARNTRTADGTPYRRKVVHFEPLVQKGPGGSQTVGVRAAMVSKDYDNPMTKIHEPSHPDADSDGFVEYPNVNAILKMADMVTAMRAYQSNLSVQENFTKIAERALSLAQ